MKILRENALSKIISITKALGIQMIPKISDEDAKKISPDVNALAIKIVDAGLDGKIEDNFKKREVVIHASEISVILRYNQTYSVCYKDSNIEIGHGMTDNINIEELIAYDIALEMCPNDASKIVFWVHSEYKS